jgi:hypothetical protein
MTLVACLTGLLVTTGALQAQIREARRHFDQANDLVSVSAYEQAIEEFRQTYLTDPWQVNAIYNIARCYERMVEAGEPLEQVVLHKRRAIDAYKNYLEVSLQVVPKEPLRDKAMASISRLRQDIERIEAERAARLRRVEEMDKEREREARERQAQEEEKKVLQERVNRILAEREEEKAKEKVLQARRSSQVKWGLGLAGAGLGIAGVGGALWGRGGTMAAEARILFQFDKPAAFDRLTQSEPFQLSGAILTACGASLATFGAIGLAKAGRGSGSLWIAAGPRELTIGGGF